MKLNALRRDSKIRRRFLLWFIGLAIAFVALAAIALTVLAMLSYKSNGDRLAAAGATFGGAAMLLAVIASLVALLAYALSTGSPDLQLRVNFQLSPANNPTLRAIPEGDNGWLRALSFKQTIVHVAVRNNSRYSAVNPAIVIRVQAMAFLAPVGSLSADWVQLELANMIGIRSIQWDGGPQFSIHGESTRILPPLNFERLFYIPSMGPAALIFEILTEGYRREVTIPVTFKVEGQVEPPEDTASQLPEWI